MSPEEILKYDLITLGIFVFGILVLVTAFLIINRKNLKEKVVYEESSSCYNSFNQKDKDYLDKLYQMKINNQITDDEYHAAVDKYKKLRDEEYE